MDEGDLDSQRLPDQARLVLKKGYFSESEILEMCGQVNRKEFTQREPHKSSTTISILTQETEKKVE